MAQTHIKPTYDWLQGKRSAYRIDWTILAAEHDVELDDLEPMLAQCAKTHHQNQESLA